MRTKYDWFALALASLLLGAIACKTLSNGSVPSQEPGGDNDTAVQVIENPPPPRSPLNQAAIDMPGLTSFQAKLHITADGTRADQPFQWIYDVSYAVSSNPILTVVTTDGSGPGKDQHYVESFFVKTDKQIVGRLSAEDACVPIDPEQAQTLLAPPGVLLPDFSAAQQTGEDTVEGLKVDRFSLSDINAGLKSEVMQVQADGAVLQANVTQDGALPQLGSQAKGHAEWAYTLSNINKNMIPDIPLACQHLIGEVPFPENIEDLEGLDTYLTFTTSMTPVEVMTFYQASLESEEWKQDVKTSGSDQLADLTYSREEITIHVIANRAGNLTSVAIFFQ